MFSRHALHAIVSEMAGTKKICNLKEVVSNGSDGLDNNR